jgi:hypothetical protein
MSGKKITKKVPDTKKNTPKKPEKSVSQPAPKTKTPVKEPKDLKIQNDDNKPPSVKLEVNPPVAVTDEYEEEEFQYDEDFEVNLTTKVPQVTG